MKVVDLIRALEAFDTELTVIIPRLEGGLEDVVACCEVLEPWTDVSHIDPASTQRAVVIDLDAQILGV
jgi:hypothetical protein